ncbi:MAG: flagellar hook-length control protein FliK [Lachnospiraceae bacterium]|nr:flagellar hook-length control protein FliK [Lachnospiraceae bacterium]
MAFSLSGLFRTNSPEPKTAVPASTRGEYAGRSGNAQVRNMTPGQTISGEVVSREGDEIQIRIAKDTMVNARMEKEIQTDVGQNITFQIRSNTSGIVALRPLFQNMAQENTALRALSQAGIEVNGKSMQMVSAMMQEGMSIDKNSLQEMYRQVANVPEGDVSAIVQMNRLQIPVTPENLQQFTAYKNYEHQLIEAFTQVAEEIPQAVADLFASGNVEEGAAFVNKLLSIFGEGWEQVENMTEMSENAAVTEEGNSQIPTEAAGEGGRVVIAEDVPKNPVQTGNIIEELPLPGAGAAEGVPGGEAEVADRIPQEDRASLARLMQNAGGSPELAEEILAGRLGTEALYRAVQELSKHARGQSEQEAVKELFLSKGFQKIFQNKIANQWTFTEPESIEKKEVEKLYERLNEQTKQLTQALAGAKADSPLARSVQNIRENVDFMNQLNQMYAYVQLPLKFRGENAHGDLYVYTNKKNLAKKEGNVSAYLHLDMEHLGTVDVYVAMEKGKINTNFYLADEKSLDLLEKHIDSLTERLTEKGYRADAKLMLKEDTGNVMEEIIQSDKNISLISDMCFDVRA